MQSPVADPGFPPDGGATLQGAPTYDFTKISQKLHEIEENFYYVDPPVIAVTKCEWA